MLDLVQPEWFVPVHGEYRHLVHHAAPRRSGRRARRTTCSSARTVTCSRSAPTAIDVERRAVPAGYQYVDGIVGDVGLGVLRDRRNLAEEGVVVVIVTVDAGTGELVTGPEIVTRGWVYEARGRRAARGGEGRGARVARRGRRRGRHRLRDPPPPRAALARQVHQRAHPPPPRDHPGRHRGLSTRAGVDPRLVDLHRRADARS